MTAPNGHWPCVQNFTTVLVPNAEADLNQKLAALQQAQYEFDQDPTDAAKITALAQATQAVIAAEQKRQDLLGQLADLKKVISTKKNESLMRAPQIVVLTDDLKRAQSELRRLEGIKGQAELDYQEAKNRADVTVTATKGELETTVTFNNPMA